MVVIFTAVQISIGASWVAKVAAKRAVVPWMVRNLDRASESYFADKAHLIDDSSLARMSKIRAEDGCHLERDLREDLVEDSGADAYGDGNDDSDEFTWKDFSRTIAVISLYVLICSWQLHRGAAAELAFGVLAGFGACWIRGDIHANGWFPIFGVLALMISLSLIVIKTFYDTYHIGLWIFEMSIFTLYLCQWLGLALYYLVQRTFKHHKNVQNVLCFWVVILFTILLL
jgi:hypothetical protein